MDLSDYFCPHGDDSYRKCLKQKMGCKHHIEEFVPVRDKNNFNLSTYNGPLPVGVTSWDGMYLYGYAEDTQPTNINQLEPHKSRPRQTYLWCNDIPEMNIPYKEVMWKLNHRCVQLAAPSSSLNTTVAFFEESRHILWSCVLETNCIPIERLIELEINYMKLLTEENHKIIEKCKQMYNLKEATQDCLSDWISSIYQTGKAETGANGLFNRVGSQVKEMLL